MLSSNSENADETLNEDGVQETLSIGKSFHQSFTKVYSKEALEIFNLLERKYAKLIQATGIDNLATSKFYIKGSERKIEPKAPIFLKLFKKLFIGLFMCMISFPSYSQYIIDVDDKLEIGLVKFEERPSHHRTDRMDVKISIDTYKWEANCSNGSLIFGIAKSESEAENIISSFAQRNRKNSYKLNDYSSNILIERSKVLACKYEDIYKTFYKIGSRNYIILTKDELLAIDIYANFDREKGIHFFRKIKGIKENQAAAKLDQLLKFLFKYRINMKLD